MQHEMQHAKKINLEKSRFLIRRRRDLNPV
nr:MAG TPA: hypothetical protein [Caudoviricetes sp.]